MPRKLLSSIVDSAVLLSPAVSVLSVVSRAEDPGICLKDGTGLFICQLTQENVDLTRSLGLQSLTELGCKII